MSLIFEKIPSNIKEYGLLIIGSLLMVLGINLFVVPLGIYNGGIIGTSQIIRTLIIRSFNIDFTFDFAGIINAFLNVPLLYLAYKGISKRFFTRTAFVLVFQALAFYFIAIPKTPIMPDFITGCAIGGIISGVGCGIILMNGASSGGLDIVGVYSSIKKTGFSVGRLSMLINFILYVICAVLFDIQVAIYSIIYACIFSVAMDKFHYQNIETSLMVFTSNKEIKYDIIKKFVRGVTHWNGNGAYTGNDIEIFVTVCSKLEASRIQKYILSKDPKAFILVNETRVNGGYEKRLV